MSRRTNLPNTASVAHAESGDKLSAPSAERNAEPLCDLLLHHAPKTGQALEIASGTGQHVVAFAAALPGLTWQPSDIDGTRLASIRAWVAEAGLSNITPATALDATAPGWARSMPPKDLILTVNLLHLISEAEVKTLIGEAAMALAPGGRLILYGPFLRDGETTSEGDARFHASLRDQNPEVGYQDDFDVIDWLHAAGLTLIDVVEMPANNLSIVATRA